MMDCGEEGGATATSAAATAVDLYSQLIGSVLAVIEGSVVALSTNVFLITANAACSRQ